MTTDRKRGAAFGAALLALATALLSPSAARAAPLICEATQERVCEAGCAELALSTAFILDPVAETLQRCSSTGCRALEGSFRRAEGYLYFDEATGRYAFVYDERATHRRAFSGVWIDQQSIYMQYGFCAPAN